MIVDGKEELSITPYILLGGGYENLSRVYEEYSDTKSQSFLTAGLGFKYRLNDYFNITLEGRALGKLDSESIDYVGTLGLDFMFGGKWREKAPMLEGLDRPRVIEQVKEKPLIKEVKKKKWITPEVVEEMFSEKKQEREVSIPEDRAIMNMQENLKALKVQMAKNEALLAEKLAKLENDLGVKKAIKEKHLARQKELEQVAVQKEQKRLLALQVVAEAKHAENMKIAQAKIVKAEKMAKALESAKAQKSLQKQLKIEKAKEARLVALALEQKKAEALGLAKEAAQKRIKEAKAKSILQESKKRGIAKDKQLLEDKKLAEYKCLRVAQKKMRHEWQS